MNKTELVDAIAKKAGLTKAQAARALDAFLDTVEETLKQGGSVVLVGFGTFTVKERRERQGRNPRTGEPMVIPAAKVPAFRPGKKLKDAVQ